MSIRLKRRTIEGYMEWPVMSRTREEAEALYAKIQRDISAHYGFAGIKLFGWTFYGGMHKSRKNYS